MIKHEEKCKLESLFQYFTIHKYVSRAVRFLLVTGYEERNMDMFNNVLKGLEMLPLKKF